MHPEYQLIATAPNGQESVLMVYRFEAETLIENYADCLNAEGRFKINGTKYFWCVPGHSENLFRMTAYGGYEPGGRGCFYQEIKED